jgi:hypothetical protein
MTPVTYDNNLSEVPSGFVEDKVLMEVRKRLSVTFILLTK